MCLRHVHTLLAFLELSFDDRSRRLGREKQGHINLNESLSTPATSSHSEGGLRSPAKKSFVSVLAPSPPTETLGSLAGSDRNSIRNVNPTFGNASPFSLALSGVQAGDKGLNERHCGTKTLLWFDHIPQSTEGLLFHA